MLLGGILICLKNGLQGILLTTENKVIKNIF